MAKLEVGEKYLRIQLAGHNVVAAFRKKDKKKQTEPDYKGDGVAVWISEAKGSQQPRVREDLL